jgi:leucyl aminopeptidase
LLKPASIQFKETDIDLLAEVEGRVALLVAPDGSLDKAARRVNRLTKGAVARLVEAKAEAASTGQTFSLAFPVGMKAESVDVVFLPRRCTDVEARKAGAALGKIRSGAALTICAGSQKRASQLALGVALRDYTY